MEARDLVALIATVFPSEPTPARGQVLYQGAYPGESEIEQVAEFFGNRRWGSVTTHDVFRFRHALPFFSPQALAYFTPAWMIASLLDENGVDTAIEDLVSNLEEADPNLWTQAQRAAICAWLNYFEPVRPGGLKARFQKVAQRFGCLP